MNRSVLKHSCPPATSAAALVALLCALGGAAQAGLQVPITRPKQTLAASKTAVRALAFSADGKLLVTGAADGHLATWLLRQSIARCTQSSDRRLSVGFRRN